MVRIQLISDLHLEHRQDISNVPNMLEPCADVLALVGDIGSPYDPKLAAFIEWAAARWPTVLYVPGNHEYYSQHRHTMTEIDHELNRICSKHPNVKLLINRCTDVGDVTFIGSTLWSWIPEEKTAYIQNYLNDFRLIYTDRGLLTPADVRALYGGNVDFIQHSIKAAHERKRTVVVLTHHAPSLHETSAPEHTGKDSCYGFASSLSCLHDPTAIRLWCAGHTHHNFHHKKEGYELISNQVGYSRPIKGYQRDFIIEV